MSKKYLYGVKYLVPFDRVTMKPKGIFEVIGGIEVGREIEQMVLSGGHADGPWAVEAGEPANTLGATLKEYPNFAYELFENATPVESTSETLGYVGTLTDTVGTSMTAAAGGIASVTIKTGEGATIPSGFLVLQATAVGTFDVYLAGDLASGRVPIVSELPKIATDVVLAGTGATVDLAGYGLTITSGTAAAALTVGDMAYVDVRPANTTRTTIQVGSDTNVNYIGVLLVYPRNAENEQTIIRFPKVGVVGMSFGANSREFSEFEQPMTPLYDEDEGFLYEMIRTKTSA